ncbi:MAG: hypothetical protein EBZ48_14385 [Proteobacteria bacterium]|nr:hypothetical protein [Pseudomonadota bacterium]
MRRLFAALVVSWLQLLHAVPLGMASPSAGPSLAGVSSFGYQLQNATVEELISSPYDLLILDYSKDGSDAAALTTEEVAAIKNSGKKVLAYLSIGEAEEYRYYFNSRWVRAKPGAACNRQRTARAPVWLEKPNTQWCDNYKVRFWMRPWQRILFGVRRGHMKSYLDRIIDAGFDGVYLDGIDSYAYWRQKSLSYIRPTAPNDMARLVVSMAQYARSSRGKSDFILVPQNGADILTRIPQKLRGEYLSAIQAIGAEDTFYSGPNEEDNPLDPQPVINSLQQFIAAGKKVFAVDYLTDSSKVLDFAQRACEQGFLPQVANRELDTLNTQVLRGCSCIFGAVGSAC